MATKKKTVTAKGTKKVPKAVPKKKVPAKVKAKVTKAKVTKISGKKETAKGKTASKKPAKKSTKKVKNAKVVDDSIIAMELFDYDELNLEIETRFRLTAEEMSAKAGDNTNSISSGLLMVDITMGNNGLKPGSWVTFYGLEQSAKSTLKSRFLIQATVKEPVPVPLNWDCDYEGSTDVKYIHGMSGVHPEQIYGRRDDKGKWVVPPKAFYYSVSSAELFFDSASALLRRLPDIEFHEGKWYYVMKESRKAQAFIKKNPDNKSLYQKHGKKLRFVERPAGGAMQAIFYIDSYSAMNPDDEEEKEEKGKGLAQRARMFSENVSKVRAKLRAKRACVVGVNQLRLRPMATGNPEYEPNGETLKFASDIRLKQVSRAASALSAWDEDEKSVITRKGTDSYRYLTIEGFKNKLAVPKLKVWTRLWVTDHKGVPRGHDPYFDVWQYLKTTDQLSGTKRKYSVRLAVTKKRVFEFGATPEELKLMVIYPYMVELNYPKKDLDKMKVRYFELLKKLGLKKTFNLRKECFSQLHSGVGYDIYVSTVQEGSSTSSAGSEASEADSESSENDTSSESSS